MVGNTYGQNIKSLEEYYEAIDKGHLAIHRGVVLDADDILRRDVITRLICHFELAMSEIERRHGIVFAEYFATELAQLRAMQGDGLLEIDRDAIRVRPVGRLLIRNICMVFDRYLRAQQGQRFSKVI